MKYDETNFLVADLYCQKVHTFVQSNRFKVIPLNYEVPLQNPDKVITLNVALIGFQID